ncbi:hypothetical protein [Natronorubrum sp. DTA7]|uniref:hypothetical protein n=1 Tax=Natronorubrum sp. DTA7 TaxID=3447016 RepID=UPI003F8515DE
MLGITDRTETADVKIRPNTAGEPVRRSDNGVGVESAAELSVSVVEFAGKPDDGFDVTIEEEGGEYPIAVECAGSDGGTRAMVFDI